MPTILCDTTAEEIIEAIANHLSDGTEAKTDLEKMVKRLYNVENFAEYKYTRNNIIEYIQSTYIL